jgi:transposase
VAAEALERIAALYAIEKEIHGWSQEERRGERNDRSQPLLEHEQKCPQSFIIPPTHF